MSEINTKNTTWRFVRLNASFINFSLNYFKRLCVFYTRSVAPNVNNGQGCKTIQALVETCKYKMQRRTLVTFYFNVRICHC